VIEPWEDGTVVRATRFPDYWDYNVVRVERDTAMSADALVAFADEALAGLAHRRVDFELADAAAPLRPRLEALGWRTTRLVWMRHEADPPPGPEVPVEEVPYDAVHDLRLAWQREDFPSLEPSAGQDQPDFFAQAREVALRRDARVLAARDAGAPVGFALLEHEGETAEIAQVFVHPEHRGRGIGTALTRAAIGAAGTVRDLWIVADDEGRPKELYRRLGFRPAWAAVEALWLP
jgi:ribosomal protein S18 acetylase RimI-like enzyme